MEKSPLNHSSDANKEKENKTEQITVNIKIKNFSEYSKKNRRTKSANFKIY